MKNYILFLFLCLNSILLAQPEDAVIQIVNGERVYVHTVQGGNTLWGIHKLYNVPVEDIVRRNPGVEGGIQDGAIIYIPVPKVSETKTHTVKGGETLFGISKIYGVSVDDIIQWNPVVKEGLQVDQQLAIHLSGYVNDIEPDIPIDVVTNDQKPHQKFNVTFNDSIVYHTVADNETFYSISKRYMVSPEILMEFNKKENTKIKPGDVIKIPVKKERIERVSVREVPSIPTQKVDSTLLFKKKAEYNVAILLPFYLDHGPGYSSTVANMATEFYMGAQMAIDSLKRHGFNAKVYVYDSQNDSAAIANVLAKPEFESMDLVIGPLYKSNIEQVATWCKQNKVRMVCPGNVPVKVIQNNPLVYTAVPSEISLIKGLANYTYKKHKNDKLVLVKPTKKEDSLLYEAFRTEYNLLSAKGGSKLIETTPGGFTSYLSRSTNLILIFPTNDKSSATKFVNELGRFSHKVNESSTYIFGTNEWLDFDGINTASLGKYKFTFADGMKFNYTDERIKRYAKLYRRRYRSDFTKMSAQGHDVMFNYCAELLLNMEVGQLIMNDFNNVQAGSSNGFENRSCYILSQREFEILNVTND